MKKKILLTLSCICLIILTGCGKSNKDLVDKLNSLIDEIKDNDYSVYILQDQIEKNSSYKLLGAAKEEYQEIPKNSNSTFTSVELSEQLINLNERDYVLIFDTENSCYYSVGVEYYSYKPIFMNATKIGCIESKERKETKKDSESKMKIDRSDIGETIYGYYREVKENYDVEEAYKYYDNTALYTWVNLGLTSLGRNERLEKLKNFKEVYNKNKNDEVLQEKINNFIKTTYTKEKFKKLNEDAEFYKLYDEIAIEMAKPVEISPDVYEVNYSYYGYDKNKDSCKINVVDEGKFYSYIYLMKQDNKYYIISNNSRWDEDYINLKNL